MEYCAEFGKRLREARHNANKSQREIAEAIGISPQMVSAYEKQERKPSIDVAAAMAGTLGVSLDYLCGNEISAHHGTSIATFADAISHISELSQYVDCKCKVEKWALPESEYEVEYWEDSNHNSVEGNLITDYPVAVICIDDYFIAEFFMRWQEIKSLYNKNIISKEIMDSWYQGEMDRLGRIKMASKTPIQGQWFGVEPLE